MPGTTDNRPAKAYRVFRMTQFGRPVLATPTAPLEMRLAGLMRFQPTTGRRAMYRRVMRALMRLGVDHWFARDVDSPLDPANGFDFNGWLGQARTDIGDPHAIASVIWPTQQHRKRIYVHLFDSSIRPIGFAKVSLGEGSDPRLAHEAGVLGRLAAMGLKECHVPRLLSNREWQGHRYLLLEPFPETAAPSPATLAVYPRACAEEIGGPERFVPADQVGGLSWWERYSSRVEPTHRLFADELEGLIRDGVRVRSAHGDFGRHNIVTAGGRLWVFDWEDFCVDAPAATDEIVFWITANFRAVLANPRTWARNFADQFLRGASPQRRCDAMMAIAFRYSLGMPSAAELMRNWACTGVEGRAAGTYREVFGPREKAEEYEKSVCQSGSYAGVLWEIERAQLAGAIAELRRTHPRIESLDFACGTGRITRFVEDQVDSSTAIEISPAMIEVARQKLKKTTILCKDVTAPGDAVEGKYDLITAFRFILNAEPALRLAALKALAARLRDQSSVLVFNNHGNLISHKLVMWPFHRIKRLGKRWTPDFNYLTDGEVRELADRAGLRVQRVMGCGLLSARGAGLLSFPRAVGWESALARWGWLSRLGGNQMYVATLKPPDVIETNPAAMPAPAAAGPGADDGAPPGDPDGAGLPGASSKPGPREAHRAVVRIIANYMRLGLHMVLGLVFVPFVWHWVGEDALGLILLLGAGVGISSIFREITNRATVRELGAAYHSRDGTDFRAVFNSTMVVAAVGAAISVALFVILYLCLPFFKVPPNFDRAAQVMVLSQGAYMVITIALCPIYNMLVVTEHFVRYNFWMLLERCTLLFSAVVLYYVIRMEDAPAAVSAWAVMVAGLQLLVFLVPVVHLAVTNPDLRPRPRLARRGAVKSASRTMAWYIATESANTLYERVSQIIMNLFFGLVGSLVYGVAFQFVSYVRQVTVGVTFGLDAVSARLSSGGSQKPLKALMHHSTRVHGLVAIPAGTAVFLLAEPLIRLWIGGHADRAGHLAAITTVVQILALALTARAISDGWVMILYGAGFIRRYAPLVLLGGVLNPVVSVALLLGLRAAGVPWLLYVTPMVYCVLHTVFQFLLVPRVAARCLSMRYREMFTPLVRPALITALCAPVLVLLPGAMEDLGLDRGLVSLAVTGVVFGVLYGLLAMGLVLSGPERERFVWRVLGRLVVRRKPSAPA